MAPVIIMSISADMCCVAPTPDEPNLYLPGFALVKATNSLKVFAGTDGCTTSTLGWLTRRMMGAKSLRESNGSLVNRWTITARAFDVPTNSVWPSAAALATYSVPMFPPTPARLSTTNCCPSASPSFWPTMRATRSTLPPAAYGTIARTGLVG